MAKAARAPQSNIVGTLAEVATALGLSLDRVKHLRSTGMPGSPGRFDLREIADWNNSRLAANTPAGSGGMAETNQQLAKVKLTREIQKARREKVLADLAERKVIELSESRKAVDQVIDWAVSIFERAAGELPALLALKPAEEIGPILLAWIEGERMSATSADGAPV